MNISLDKNLKIPLYKQIKNQLRDMICTGVLPKGYTLPSERTLAKSLGVNRTTVIAAYEELKAENLIVSQVGKGTVVVYNKITNHSSSDDIKRPPWNLLINYQNNSPQNFFINDIIEMSNNPEIISFAANLPSPEMFPFKKIADIQQEMLDISPGQIINQSNVYGFDPLRENICNLMDQKNINVLTNQLPIYSVEQNSFKINVHLLL